VTPFMAIRTVLRVTKFLHTNPSKRFLQGKKLACDSGLDKGRAAIRRPTCV
jgi:hypothetical protein